MSEENRLTDEQLDGITGGSDWEYSVTLNGVTLTLGGPDTYLEFSKMERSGGTPSWTGYGVPMEYYDWYYSYYNGPHPFDFR